MIKTMTVKELIDDTIDHKEGVKYTDRPNDRGGPTKYGITLATLSHWRGYIVTPDDVKYLERSEAFDIYEHLYFLNPSINELPEIIRPVVFDMAVNHGPNKAIKLLQEVLAKMHTKKVAIDGVIGPITIAAANIAVNVYGVDVVNQICNRREAFYQSIVALDSSQAENLAGWINRARSFHA